MTDQQQNFGGSTPPPREPRRSQTELPRPFTIQHPPIARAGFRNRTVNAFEPPGSTGTHSPIDGSGSRTLSPPGYFQRPSNSRELNDLYRESDIFDPNDSPPYNPDWEDAYANYPDWDDEVAYHALYRRHPPLRPAHTLSRADNFAQGIHRIDWAYPTGPRRLPAIHWDPNLPAREQIPAQANDTHARVETANEFVAGLRTLNLDELPAEEDGSPSRCPICADSYSADDLPVRTPCGHTMGRSCLHTWLGANARGLCPFCRRQLVGRGIQNPTAAGARVQSGPVSRAPGLRRASPLHTDEQIADGVTIFDLAATHATIHNNVLLRTGIEVHQPTGAPTGTGVRQPFPINTHHTANRRPARQETGRAGLRGFLGRRRDSLLARSTAIPVLPFRVARLRALDAEIELMGPPPPRVDLRRVRLLEAHNTRFRQLTPDELAEYDGTPRLRHQDMHIFFSRGPHNGTV